MSFGKELKRLRMKRGFSIRELARNTGLSHPYISQLENGKRGIPSEEVIKKIGGQLGDIDYDILMHEAGYLKYLDEILANYKFRIVPKAVFVPENIEFKDHQGVTVTKATMDKDIFDLYYLAMMGLDEHSDFDLFYKGRKISKKELKKITTMIQTLLD